MTREKFKDVECNLAAYVLVCIWTENRLSLWRIVNRIDAAQLFFTGTSVVMYRDDDARL